MVKTKEKQLGGITLLDEDSTGNVDANNATLDNTSGVVYNQLNTTPGNNSIWIDDSIPSLPKFTDSAGTTITLGEGSGSNIGQQQETIPVGFEGQTNFSLSLAPPEDGYVMMFINGQKQQYGDDYVSIGAFLSYTGDLTLLTTDIVEFWYLTTYGDPRGTGDPGTLQGAYEGGNVINTSDGYGPLSVAGDQSISLTSGYTSNFSVNASDADAVSLDLSSNNLIGDALINIVSKDYLNIRSIDSGVSINAGTGQSNFTVLANDSDSSALALSSNNLGDGYASLFLTGKNEVRLTSLEGEIKISADDYITIEATDASVNIVSGNGNSGFAAIGDGTDFVHLAVGAASGGPSAEAYLTLSASDDIVMNAIDGYLDISSTEFINMVSSEGSVTILGGGTGDSIVGILSNGSEDTLLNVSSSNSGSGDGNLVISASDNISIRGVDANSSVEITSGLDIAVKVTSETYDSIEDGYVLSWNASGGYNEYIEAGGSGGSGTPSGSNTEIQFNDSGSFGSNSSFTYNESSSELQATGLTLINFGSSGGNNFVADGFSNHFFVGESTGQFLANDHTNVNFNGIGSGTFSADDFSTYSFDSTGGDFGANGFNTITFSTIGGTIFVTDGFANHSFIGDSTVGGNFTATEHWFVNFDGYGAAGGEFSANDFEDYSFNGLGGEFTSTGHDSINFSSFGSSFSANGFTTMGLQGNVTTTGDFNASTYDIYAFYGTDSGEFNIKSGTIDLQIGGLLQSAIKLTTDTYNSIEDGYVLSWNASGGYNEYIEAGSSGVLRKTSNVSSDPAPTTSIIESNEITYLADSTGASFTVTIPGSSTEGGQPEDGTIIRIKNVNGVNANAITVATDGTATIDGEDTLTIGTQYGAVTVQSDGFNYHTI